ncbi:OPT oligopeptide transporter protein-domain-containing protein [Mycena crocata]|nr:OPT oligopeptide transporter protein-domain-containing protein [Mycena crocata]
MYFTLYGYNTLEQALGLLRDLKMLRQQYTKLPPRVTFAGQSLGAVVGGLINYVIMKVIISTYREILLDVQGSNIWSGQQVQSFNSDAVSWGALGKDLYAPGSRYGIIPFSIIIGLIVPVPFWIAHRSFPKLGANHVMTTVLCCSCRTFHLGGIIKRRIPGAASLLVGSFIARSVAMARGRSEPDPVNLSRSVAGGGS